MGRSSSRPAPAPASHWPILRRPPLRRQNDARVIVSTDTINLQEQLTGKDLPCSDVSSKARPQRGLPPSLCDSASLKAGATTFACCASPLCDVPRRSRFPKPACWRESFLAPTNRDRRPRELNLSPQEDAVWKGLSADNESCLSFACHYARHGACFLQRARRRAEASHIVVVNHALLLSDIATGGHVLPEYRHLIVDEAHNLEEEATQQFGFQATDDDVRALIDRVYHRLPVVAPAASSTACVSSSAPAARMRRPTPPSSPTSWPRPRRASVAPCRTLFDLLLSASLFDRGAAQGDFDPRLLLNRSMRVQPDWSNVEVAWENVDTSAGEREPVCWPDSTRAWPAPATTRSCSRKVPACSRSRSVCAPASPPSSPATTPTPSPGSFTPAQAAASHFAPRRCRSRKRCARASSPIERAPFSPAPPSASPAASITSVTPSACKSRETG